MTSVHKAVAKVAVLTEGPDRDLAEAVSNLRQDRNAELEALRGKKSTNMFHHQFEAKKGSNEVVLDLNDFYMRQRSKVEGEKKKRGDAEKKLHQYRQDDDKAKALTEASDPSMLSVADRAAATAYLNSKYSQQSVKTVSTVVAPAASSPTSVVDFTKANYRAFVFIIHQNCGMLLLHCTRDRSKGPHFQLPGGRINQNEFIAAARTSDGNPKVHLLAAAKLGASRSLFEQTSIDVRANLKRLQPAPLRSEISDKELYCEVDQRIYFFLRVTDKDFWTEEREGYESITRSKLDAPLRNNGKNLMLQLSGCHSGFKFEEDPRDAANQLKKHSDGVGSEALLMALTRSKDTTSNGAVDNSNKNGRKFAIDKQVGREEPAVTNVKDEVSGEHCKVERSITAYEEHLDLLPKKKPSSLFSCFRCCY